MQPPEAIGSEIPVSPTTQTAIAQRPAPLAGGDTVVLSGGRSGSCGAGRIGRFSGETFSDLIGVDINSGQ
jgi:hypothetical protein